MPANQTPWLSVIGMLNQLNPKVPPYCFSNCTTTDGCFDYTYTAPDNNFIYYMTLPGYGNVDYTKYVITLTGDPTATMKLTVLADTGKVSVNGPCTSTFTIDGRR